MELNEFQILQRQTGAGDHGVTISRTSVSTRTTEVGTAITSGGQNSLVSTEAVEGSILHVQGDDANTFAVLHNEVKSKIFNEEVSVVFERLSVERVEDGVSRSICSSSATVSLTALAVLEGLTTKRPLVDFAVDSTRERDTEMLQLMSLVSNVREHASSGTDLNYGGRRLTTHVVDSILITKPVRTFDLNSKKLGELVKEA